MVKNSSGEDGYRSFTVVNMTKSDGCLTKFTGGRYVAKTPALAARKALSYHCAVKRIRGRCALYIKVKETTQGSKGKHYTYLAHRVKLDTPIDLVNPFSFAFNIPFHVFIIFPPIGE